MKPSSEVCKPYFRTAWWCGHKITTDSHPGLTVEVALVNSCSCLRFLLIWCVNKNDSGHFNTSTSFFEYQCDSWSDSKPKQMRIRVLMKMKIQSVKNYITYCWIISGNVFQISLPSVSFQMDRFCFRFFSPKFFYFVYEDFCFKPTWSLRYFLFQSPTNYTWMYI